MIGAQSCRRDKILGVFYACANSMNLEDAFSFRKTCVNYCRSPLANGKVFLLSALDR